MGTYPQPTRTGETMADQADNITQDAAASEGADEQQQATQSDASESETDLAAEVEKWKQFARKHEERAKANSNAAKELEKLKQASMTEQEKAVEQARAEARAEALREVGVSLVEAQVKVAANGRGVDVDALLEGLDKTKFLNGDGQPDTEAITKWVDRIAPDDKATQVFPDLGQGRGVPADKKHDMNSLIRRAAGER